MAILTHFSSVPGSNLAGIAEPFAPLAVYRTNIDNLAIEVKSANRYNYGSGLGGMVVALASLAKIYS
jgi:hypothetical protein